MIPVRSEEPHFAFGCIVVNRRLIIISIDHTAAQILELDWKNAVGKRITQFIPLSRVKPIRKFMLRLLMTEENFMPIPNANFNVTANGKIKMLAWANQRLFDAGGEPVLHLVVRELGNPLAGGNPEPHLLSSKSQFTAIRLESEIKQFQARLPFLLAEMSDDAEGQAGNFQNLLDIFKLPPETAAKVLQAFAHEISLWRNDQSNASDKAVAAVKELMEKLKLPSKTRAELLQQLVDAIQDWLADLSSEAGKLEASIKDLVEISKLPSDTLTKLIRELADSIRRRQR